MASLILKTSTSKDLLFTDSSSITAPYVALNRNGTVYKCPARTATPTSGDIAFRRNGSIYVLNNYDADIYVNGNEIFLKKTLESRLQIKDSNTTYFDVSAGQLYATGTALPSSSNVSLYINGLTYWTGRPNTDTNGWDFTTEQKYFDFDINSASASVAYRCVKNSGVGMTHHLYWNTLRKNWSLTVRSWPSFNGSGDKVSSLYNVFGSKKDGTDITPRGSETSKSSLNTGNITFGHSTTLDTFYDYSAILTDNDLLSSLSVYMFFYWFGSNTSTSTTFYFTDDLDSLQSIGDDVSNTSSVKTNTINKTFQEYITDYNVTKSI